MTPLRRDAKTYLELESVLNQSSSRNSKKVANVSRPYFQHNDILDQPVGRTVVPQHNSATSVNNHLVIDYPTIDQYISLTPRRVTPIYAKYAASIVELLDIHVIPPPFEADPVHILDAGTGHGSLALHLARAIAGANYHPPKLELPKTRILAGLEETEASQARQARLLRLWAAYKNLRRAIVHTVEAEKNNRWHAENIIRGFRQGLYWPHIDFYHARLTNWVKDNYARRGPFLSYAVLDLPNIHKEISIITRALLPSAKLAVFVPSVSQITECHRFVKDNGISLHLDRVIELGEGISTGRVWDIRLEVPRGRGKSSHDSYSFTTEADLVEPEALNRMTGDDTTNPHLRSDPDKVMVCRPKVGLRIEGGGFVALWQKKSDKTSATGAISDGSSVISGFERVPSEGPIPNDTNLPQLDNMSKSAERDEITNASLSQEAGAVAGTHPPALFPGSKHVDLSPVRHLPYIPTSLGLTGLTSRFSKLLGGFIEMRPDLDENERLLEFLKSRRFRDLIHSIKVSALGVVRLEFNLAVLTNLRAANILWNKIDYKDSEDKAVQQLRRKVELTLKKVVLVIDRQLGQIAKPKFQITPDDYSYLQCMSLFETPEAYLDYVEEYLPVRLVQTIKYNWAQQTNSLEHMTSEVTERVMSEPEDRQGRFWPSMAGDPFMEMSRKSEPEDGI